jgi:YHS domain-containing protein
MLRITAHIGSYFASSLFLDWRIIVKNNVLVMGFAAILASSAMFGVVGNEAVAAPVFVGVEGGNIAVSGYDAVSYFSGTGVPVRGNAKFAVKHDGAVYHFATSENADRFSANPAAFAPQFGGHCAWAMARGYLAPADPEQYAVVEGKLYLNFNAEVKAKWDKDRANFITSGHTNWKKVPADAKFGG